MIITIEEARAWYPALDPVHGFDHILRVYRLATALASQEGANLAIVQAAALLHDALPPEAKKQPDQRQAHHHSSADFARQVLQKADWPEDQIVAVQHCIRAHRFREAREQPQTLEAQVLFDADKLDAIGAIGVARAVAYAAARGQPIYAEPSPEFLKTGRTCPGEAHTPYHEYLFKLRKLRDRLYTPAARRLADERHRYMSEYFERLRAECAGQA